MSSTSFRECSTKSTCGGRSQENIEESDGNAKSAAGETPPTAKEKPLILPEDLR